MNRHRRKTRPRIDPQAVRLAAAIRGCRCTPDLEHFQRSGIRHLILRHDCDCPAVDTPSQLIVARGRHTSSDQLAGAVAEILQAIEEAS